MSHELSPQDRSAARAALIKAGIATRGMSDQQLQAEAAGLAGMEPAPAPFAPKPGSCPACNGIGMHTADCPVMHPTQPTQEPQPMQAQPTAPAADLGNQIAQLIASSMTPAAPAMDEARIVELIKQHAEQHITVTVNTTTAAATKTKTIKGAHSALPQVLDLLSIYPATNRAPYLVGPAGSGKTTIAIQAADSLGLPFFSTGAVFDKFELLGFQNAGGEYVKSALFKAYTQGGVFLFDEIDASAPEAMVAFNQLVANGVYTFPDGELHHKHDDFLPMAAANTIGNGATRRYAARVPLDGATLDRFNQLEITYDAALEKRLMIEAGTVINADVCRQSLSAWLATVRTARTWADKQQLDVLITPRDSIAGAALIARGWELPAIKAATIHSKLTADQIAQLARA